MGGRGEEGEESRVGAGMAVTLQCQLHQSHEFSPQSKLPTPKPILKGKKLLPVNHLPVIQAWGGIPKEKKVCDGIQLDDFYLIVHQVGWDSEKRVSFPTSEDLGWPYTFPSLSTGIRIELWRGGFTWGKVGGQDGLWIVHFLWPFHIKEECDYQSLKITWYYSIR